MFHIDFESKKIKGIMNFVKYGLTAVVVVAATVALVYAAGGYDIDRKTGEIVQNGLVLIASEPVSADVHINGEDEGDPTSSKFSLPIGQYNFELKREGYHDWVKKVTIDSTDVIWLQYPRLIPTEIKTKNIEAFKEVGMASQTPDRKHILIHENGGDNTMTLFSTENPDTPEQVTIPSAVLSTQVGVPSSFIVLDWAQDNRTVVLEHTNGTTKELILLDVAKADEAMNLSSLYALPMAELHFIDNSNDTLYALVNTSLRKLDVVAGTVSASLMNDVAQYDSKDGLVAAVHGKAGETKVSLIDGDKVYKYMDLNEVAAKYILETDKYDGERYLAVADNSQGRVFVYENIINTAKNSEGPQILSQLRLATTKFLSFSNNSQFVLAQNGKDSRLYDLDLEVKRAFTLKQAVDSSTELTWVDGFHLNFIDTKSQTHFIDYDGLNVHELTKVNPTLGVFYSPDGEGLYSFSDASAGSDILNFSSLLAEEN